MYTFISVHVYTYIFMSARQYSLHKPVPWTNGDFGASGGFCHNIITLLSWTHGASLRGGGGGAIAFGTFCMIPISYGIPSLSP